MPRRHPDRPISTHAELAEALRAAAPAERRACRTPLAIVPGVLAGLDGADGPSLRQMDATSAIAGLRVLRPIMGGLLAAAAALTVAVLLWPLDPPQQANQTDRPTSTPAVVIARTYSWSLRTPEALADRLAEPFRREAELLALSTRRALDLLPLRLPAAGEAAAFDPSLRN